jgi:hypothetical protein
MPLRNCCVILAALLAACGDAGHAGTNAPVRPESVPSPPSAVSPILRSTSGASVTEMMRIDGKQDSLVSVDDAIVGPDLSVIVTQGQDRQLRFYDSAGARQSTVGGPGTRPGEFTRIVRLGWVGDTVWVWDQSLRRLSFFGANGRFLRTAAPLPSFVSPLAVYGSGNVLISGKPEGRQSAPAGRQRPWLVTTTKGVAIQRLGSMPYVPSSVTEKTSTGGTVSAEIPFAANTRDRVSQDGKRIGFVATDFRTRRFNVVVHDSSGQRVFDRQYPFDAFRIPRHAIDSVIAEKRRTRPPPVAALYDRMHFPEFYAPVQQLLFGTDNSVLVRLYRPGSERVWLVIAPNGEPVDTLRLPPKAWPAAASLDNVWVVQPDEFGVPSIVRYHIDRSIRVSPTPAGGRSRQ